MVSQKKPNFLIIFPDTLGANAVSCYGNPDVKTPNIDKLAETGVKFNNCTSQNPVCQPSRASLLTGKYVGTHGIRDNGVANFPTGHLIFPEYLGELGYKRAYYGKTHSVDKSKWDDVFDLYPDYNKYLKGRGIPVTYPEREPLENRLNHGYSRIPAKDWATNVLGNIGKRFIEDQKASKDPFCLFMSFEAPHSPCTLPLEYKDLYSPDKIILPDVPEEDMENKPEGRLAYLKTRRKSGNGKEDLKWALSIYYGLATVMDENIGKLVDALDDNGLRDDTVIIFLSDHGDFMANHGAVGKCISVEQSLIHVPLIVNCPAKFAHSEIDALVESIDVFPTISDLAAGEKPRGLQGESLIPHVLGKADHEREVAFSEEHYHPWLSYFAVRDKQFKFTISSNGDEELYDIEKDNYEWYNLAAKPEFKEKIAWFKDKIIKWRFDCIDNTVESKVDWVSNFMHKWGDDPKPYLVE